MLAGGKSMRKLQLRLNPRPPVDQTYPIEQIQEVAEVMLAYPIDPNSADYDEQMEEYLTQLFGDKHKLESLLEKIYRGRIV